MKLHIITIGTPKLAYAQTGWQEYLGRLKHYHQLRITHLADKHAYDAKKLSEAIGNSYCVALEITGKQHTSEQLATWLEQRAQDGREVTLIIGGPAGLPASIIDAADATLSLSKLTFPHDLAMLVLLEALYRASTINAGTPYHK